MSAAGKKYEKFQAPKGVSEYVTPQSAPFEWVREQLIAPAKLAGYQLMELPVFEDTQLFTRGVGESTDVVSKEPFQGEIGQLHRACVPQTVQCPLPGCETTYEMYGCTPSNRDESTATLQGRLQREHPGHGGDQRATHRDDFIVASDRASAPRAR